MEIKKSKKNVKFTTIAWFMAIMLLVIIIPINIAASLFDVQVDLTSNNLYSLTDISKDYLSKLDKDVDFYLLMDTSELEGYDEAMSLLKVLEEYSSYDHINFKAVDPEAHPEIKEEFDPNGYLSLTKGDMILRCGDNVKRVEGVKMYDDIYDLDGNVTGLAFVGENVITGAIKSVVEGKIPSVYFLTGHGEKTLENDYTNLRKNLGDFNYNAHELNLTSAEKVPDDAAIIIVPAPKTDITDQEREKIEKYMDGGGNLSLMMSPNDDDFNYDNLESIMHKYGIGMDYNIVSDTDPDNHVSGDDTTIMFNLVDVSELNDSSITDLTSELIENTSSLVPYMPASRSFYQYQNTSNENLTICPLIETYDSAVGKPYGGEEVDPDAISGKLYLGAYSENTENGSKLVVMGNAEFIDDENASEMFTVVPIMLYSRTITWMYGSDTDMNINMKADKNDYMILENRSDTNAMMVLLNSAPVVIAVSGIFVWLKRRHA